MNKASCLSLVSNAILVWNTLQIARIVETLRVRLSNPRLMSSPDFSG
jgi:TnpA family transposase